MVKKTTIDGQVDFIMHRRYVLFAAGSSATQSVSIDTLSFGQPKSITTNFDTHLEQLLLMIQFFSSDRNHVVDK